MVVNTSGAKPVFMVSQSDVRNDTPRMVSLPASIRVDSYASGKRQFRNVVVEILESADTGTVETEALVAERATLMTRVAEIDALLN